MFGFYGRLLQIDLSANAFTIDPIEEEITRSYLGGKGLASYFLCDLNPAGVNPLSPDNHLIIATGPITGSKVWGSCRYGIFTKSPLTNFYSESYSGGRLPEAIAATGFDAIIIKGCMKLPTLLEITPSNVIFHQAEKLWGMDTYTTLKTINKHYSKNQSIKNGAMVIGPAGENQVAFAAIQNDQWHFAGRTGPGAVMGSKNIKAIVFRGDQNRKLADPDRITKIYKRLSAESKNNAVVQAYKTKGTPMMVDITNSAGCFPAKYWTQGSVSHQDKINADALHTQCRVTPEACAKCFMACGRKSKILKGRHADLEIKGPEYETIYVFGGLCMVDDINEIIFLNDLCNRLGIDTITAGNLCAFTIEAVKARRVNYSIDYGQVEAIANLIYEMSECKGEVGWILAKGIKYAAKKWKLEDRSVHVKGLEPAGFDPRRLKGMGLAYAISDRGACHLRATFYKPELAGMISPNQVEEKAKLFIEFEDRLTIFDTLILCRFFRDIYDWDLLGQVVGAVTGKSYDNKSLRSIASSVTDTVRRFNLREGLTLEDDTLPTWIYQNSIDDKSNIKRAELEKMRSDYYNLRGWSNKGDTLNN